MGSIPHAMNMPCVMPHTILETVDHTCTALRFRPPLVPNLSVAAPRTTCVHPARKEGHQAYTRLWTFPNVVSWTR
eukprot:scaffold2911_cov40-Tisochrysis_lutea.AAC.1